MMISSLVELLVFSLLPRVHVELFLLHWFFKLKNCLKIGLVKKWIIAEPHVPVRKRWFHVVQTLVLILDLMVLLMVVSIYVTAESNPPCHQQVCCNLVAVLVPVSLFVDVLIHFHAIRICSRVIELSIIVLVDVSVIIICTYCEIHFSPLISIVSYSCCKTLLCEYFTWQEQANVLR